MDIHLEEWEFVVSNGMTFVGKLDPNKPRTISPVFEVCRPFVPMELPDGTQSITPALMLRQVLNIQGGIRSLTFPEGALRVSLTAFYDPGAKQMLEGVLAQTVSSLMQARAKAAGLVLPPGGVH